MKTLFAGFLTAAAALFAGCVVTAVHPYYRDCDLVNEPALTGEWRRAAGDADAEIWRFDTPVNRAWRLTIIEGRNTTALQARAFKLEGQLFLDLTPGEQDDPVAPPHFLLKVTPTSPGLRMSELNQVWLADLVARDPGAIRHQFVTGGETPGERRLVLEADTAELQAFVLKNLNTPEAWKDNFDLSREPQRLRVKRPLFAR